MFRKSERNPRPKIFNEFLAFLMKQKFVREKVFFSRNLYGGVIHLPAPPVGLRTKAFEAQVLATYSLDVLEPSARPGSLSSGLRI